MRPEVHYSTRAGKTNNKLLSSLTIPQLFIDWAFQQLRQQSKGDAQEFAHKRRQIQKKIDSSEVMIDNLIDKLTAGIIETRLFRKVNSGMNWRELVYIRNFINMTIIATTGWIK